MLRLQESDVQKYLAKVRDLIREPIPEQIEDNHFISAELFYKRQTEITNPSQSVQMGEYEFFASFIGGGLRPHEFSILCGPTGKGKTTWLLNLAVQLMAQWTPVMIACVENGADKAMEKMVSMVSGKRIFQGMQRADADIAFESAKNILNSHSSVFMRYDSRVSHLRFLADVLYCYETYGTKVVLVDNLNFMMEVKRASDQLIEMDRTVHEFIVFCKKIPVHVIMVMHPKKTDNGRVESEFDVKGSSTAVQEAANVFLFNPLSEEAMQPDGTHAEYCREIKLAKLREAGRHVGKRIIYAIDSRSEKMREVGHV